MEKLPTHFVRTVSLTFRGGEEWLEQLPQIISACERRWSLNVHPPFAQLSYNYVAPATLADGRKIVLKLGVPRDELTTEIEALRLYNGRACCRLLDADAEMGVLLLERLCPGRSLDTLPDDEEATRIAAQLMRRLWRPLPADHRFPTVADWADGLKELRQKFDGGAGPFPRPLVETAESLFADLLASSAEPVLLHGDLHHFNILAAEREPWLIIDPKGVAGEPAYEVGALLRNPIPHVYRWPDLARITERRLDILAEVLDMDRARLAAWSLAQEVLSAWWDYEDLGGDGWQMDTALADVLVSQL